MRKVSILFFFCFTVVRAQYFPVGMTWEEIIVNPEMDTESSSVIYGTHLFEISSDTLIDGATYRNVMVDGNSCDLYIRENGEKVWLLSNDYPSEILLYDFAWDNGQYIVTEHLKEQDNGELKLIRDTMMVGDYQTTTFDSQTYQYHRDSFHRSTIRGIGNVAELNRNFCLLGYKEKRTPLPGLDYFKVHWIMKDGRVIFQSENVADWTIAVPSYETIDTGYHPMLEVGKVWNYECVHYFLDDQGKIYYEKSPYKEWIEGDTIVNGVTYYKMHSSPLDFPVASESLWREDGCRVYCYGKTTKSEVLMYDFGLKTGDELSIMDFPFEVSRTDTILVNGTERKRILLNLGGGWKVNWVEGIGGEGLLAEPLGHLLSDGNVSRLLSCYKNDSCLFTASDFEVQGMTDAVHAITHDDGQSVVFYDLQGRRVQNKPAKGVYIRGGRKVVVK